MNTASNSLGTSLPIPSTPPSTIFVHSSNEDVKLWLYYCLRKNYAYINEDEAWALARTVKGEGQSVLDYSEKDWENQVPGWGTTVYIALELSQEDLRRTESSNLAWSLKQYYSSWLNVVGFFKLSEKKICNKQQFSRASGLTKTRDYQGPSSSDEERISTFGKTSPACLSNEQDGSQKRHPFHHDTD